MRRKLDDRRPCRTVTFEHDGKKYHLTVGFFPDRTPGEIFLNSGGKAGSEADVNMSDAAVAVSLALQHGCPLDVLRDATKRTPSGAPQGPLAAALDLACDVTREIRS